jgi:hypothetical protein
MPFTLTVRKPFVNNGNNTYSSEVPIGTIVAWHPRLFSGPNNSGVGTSDRIQLPSNWVLCDGRDLSANPLTKDSPLIDAGFKRVPDITDNRFLMGGSSTTFLGNNYVYGGANHAGPPISNSNNGNNSITISTANLPPHVHGPGTLNIPSKTTSDQSANHTHGMPAYVGFQGDRSDISDPARLKGFEPWSTITYGVSNGHTHSFSITSAEFSGNTSDGGFLNNSISVLPKYLIVKYIMRVK